MARRRNQLIERGRQKDTEKVKRSDILKDSIAIAEKSKRKRTEGNSRTCQ